MLIATTTLFDRLYLLAFTQAGKSVPFFVELVKGSLNHSTTIPRYLKDYCLKYKIMVEEIPEDITKDLDMAVTLHQRATSDYEKCMEFNKLMSDVLGRLEDNGCFRTADKVMGILLECNPKDGAHCDNAVRVEKKMSGPLYPGKKH